MMRQAGLSVKRFLAFVASIAQWQQRFAQMISHASLTVAVRTGHTGTMSIADKVTASRIVLAPVFFVFFSWGSRFGIPHLPLAIGLWALIIIMELSDMFDGMLARGTGSVSSFGKLFDPFADVLSHLTTFLCFVLVGIMPAWAFLIILFREYSMLFLRLLLIEKGVAMGARKGGKLKSFMYAVSLLVSLLYWTLAGLSIGEQLLSGLFLAVQVLYALCVLLTVLSFLDYIREFRKITRTSQAGGQN